MRHVHLIFAYREQLTELVENSSAATLSHGTKTVDLLEAFFAWRKKNNLGTPVVFVVKDLAERQSGAIQDKYLSVGVGTTTLEQYVGPQQLPKGVEVQAIDTTGLGDAAAAGFIFGLLNGAPLEACIDVAFLMAAFASSEIGARGAFTARQDRSLLSAAQRRIRGPIVAP